MFKYRKTHYGQDVSYHCDLSVHSVQSQSECQQATVWRLTKVIPKFIWRGKGPRRADTILENTNTLGGLMASTSKASWNATVIRTGWCWWKKRQAGNWNRIESPEMDRHINIVNLSVAKEQRQFKGLSVRLCSSQQDLRQPRHGNKINNG